MGIWKYSNKFPKHIEKRFRLSLGEGNTPLEKINFDGREVYLKREDKNPTGSHKDRGLTYQISAHLCDNKNKFVISSSGNASISAISLLRNKSFQLDVFLSPKINSHKRKRLSKIVGREIKAGIDQQIDNINIHFSDRAVSDAFKFSKSESAVLLRGSTDPYAVPGFSTISYELEEQLPDLTDIFIPSSSGTTAVGVYQGFENSPKIHICQTESVNTLVRSVSHSFEQSSDSIVDSIVDKVGHRKDEIEEIIDRSGYGWVVSDQDIIKYRSIFQKLNIKCSNEGILGFSSYIKALDKGIKIERPVILISGKI